MEREMKTKMSRQDFIDLFPPYLGENTNDMRLLSNATKKGHKHKHNPSKKPSEGKVIPAVFRRRHLGRKKV
jgi:hypothetical protein